MVRYLKRLKSSKSGRAQAFPMYGGLGMSAPSLHRESTDSLILLLVYTEHVLVLHSLVCSWTVQLTLDIHVYYYMLGYNTSAGLACAIMSSKWKYNIRESVYRLYSLCRDDADMPMAPYIRKACNHPNVAFVSLFR